MQNFSELSFDVIVIGDRRRSAVQHGAVRCKARSHRGRNNLHAYSQVFRFNLSWSGHNEVLDELFVHFLRERISR